MASLHTVIPSFNYSSSIHLCIFIAILIFVTDSSKNFSDDPSKERTIYILEWADWTRWGVELQPGNQSFVQHGCPKRNCYVTEDRNFFGNGNESQFDIVVFNGLMNPLDVPKTRSPHQVYLFSFMESSDNFPLCHSIFNGFFNRTATYKLNSDIAFVYFQVFNKHKKVISPKVDVKWGSMRRKYVPSNRQFYNKSKAAAWFVSHCKARSNRDEFVLELNKELSNYGLGIDIYGDCGPYKCPLQDMQVCCQKLENDYYFYMALENSFSEDYVTEKVLTGLEHFAVPIVFGGANYTRFLPPGSYIDGLKYSKQKDGLKSLASLMRNLMNNPKEYFEYFKWRNYYTFYEYAPGDHSCILCEELDRFVKEYNVYDDFRKWWNPDYKERCEFTNYVNLKFMQ